MPAHAAPVTAETPDPDASRHLSISAAQLAAWGFAFLLLRIFAVSGYDWDTAYLVSTTLGLTAPSPATCSASTPDTSTCSPTTTSS